MERIHKIVRKPIVLAVLGLVLLIALLAGVKAMQINSMIAQGKKTVPPPQAVTSAVATLDAWETALTSVGTLVAVQGVTVAAELAGKVVGIDFEAGTPVKKGDILLRQDTSIEKAQLPGAEAQLKLAHINLKRADELFSRKLIAQAERDTAVMNAKQANARAEDIKAVIAKKTIRAPFSGKLGIRQVNLGQVLKEGDPIVTLQTLDPIYADFALPQQQLSSLVPGMKVRVTSDVLPGKELEGRITAINPLVDADTRQIRLQATARNPSQELRPGMFVNIEVPLAVRRKVLAIPATAVLYAPYGDSVFVVHDAPDKKGKLVHQQFVRLGQKRGDFVAVTNGLKEGETVVSTGVFKLRNGDSVLVDNHLAPDFRKWPRPENK